MDLPAQYMKVSTKQRPRLSSRHLVNLTAADVIEASLLQKAG